MRPTPRPRIKVCRVSSVDEAWTAIRNGAPAPGRVSAMPGGPGVIRDRMLLLDGARVPTFAGAA